MFGRLSATVAVLGVIVGAAACNSGLGSTGDSGGATDGSSAATTGAPATTGSGSNASGAVAASGTSTGGSTTGPTPGGTSTTTGSATAGGALPEIGGTGFYELLAGTGGSGGTATATGTVDGNTLTPATAVFDVAGDNSGDPYLVYVALSSDPNFCDQLVQNSNHIANSDYLVLTTFEEDPNAKDPNGYDMLADIKDPFTVMTARGKTVGNEALVQFYSLDATCADRSNTALIGTAGTVTLSALGLTATNGSFNVTVGNSGSIAGSFQAAACPGLAGAIMAAKKGGCAP